MTRNKLVSDLQILGGPIDREELHYEATQTHLQEVTRAKRHLEAMLDATAEEQFVDNLASALFHLERVRNEILCNPIPLVVKIGTIKIPYENE